jgi:Flp pilus assembly protein TadD
MTREARVCGSCGAKNHPKWRACQRCGTALTAPPARAAAASRGKEQPTASGLPKAAWMGGGALACLVIVAAIAMPRSSSAPSSTAAARRTTSAGQSVAPAAHPVQPNGQAGGLAVDTRSDLVHQSSLAYERGDFDGALDILKRAVAANPSDAVAQNNLGQVLVRLNRVPEALPHLAAATELEPSNWSYKFNLARAQGLSGDWAAAVTSYQQADQLFPNDHVTLFNLAQALQKANRSDEAIGVLERVVAAAPGDPSFLLSLGSAYEQAGRAQDAASTFSKYLDAAPDGPQVAPVKAHLARLQAGKPAGDAPAIPADAPQSAPAEPPAAPAPPA